MEERDIEVTVSPVFRCRLDGMMREFLDVFGLMVDWWLQKLSSGSYSSFSSFRKQFYMEGKKRWGGWNTQHLQSSCLVAFKLREMFERKLKFAVLSPLTVKIHGRNLVVSTRRREFGKVVLSVSGGLEQGLLQLAENSSCRIGQVFLTERWVIIPFILKVNLNNRKSIVERLISEELI